MSVDINWETLTGGPDGQALAETIRAFIHERFQHVHFPKLIRSVKVHGFDFGTTAPQIVLKDFGDPLPDFYENDGEGDEDRDADSTARADLQRLAQHHPQTANRNARPNGDSRRPSELELLRQAQSPMLTRGAPPGMLGATSNLGYFHMPLSAGLPGTNTPLAAVAGAHFHGGLHTNDGVAKHNHSDSFNSVTPPTLTPVSSRPVSRDNSYFDPRRASAVLDGPGSQAPTEQADHERSPDDMQVVFHVTYSGDVRLSMTADVFLDFPMPSFVGIPLKLNITGLTFNGVGILAYIKKRAHLCFLSPEDAEALIGGENQWGSPGASDDAGPTDKQVPHNFHKVGGLLEEIHIESEMGETEDGKQVLKNVGKIEKFILEQVQRIFEDEFVYPSFWTFLV